jgi:C1A family cysteine protease
MTIRKWGWIKQPHDDRDFIYRASIKVLPKSVDLRNLCSPVEDQGDLGSCTANATVGAIELLENKFKLPFVDKSRLFLYYQERVLDGTVQEDAGGYLRDAIKAAWTWGVCSEKVWPYDVNKFAKRPSLSAYIDAVKHRVTAYYAIKSALDMKDCLASGYPFVFGFQVYESFESESVAKTGIVPMPKSNESILGGHAVMAWGDKGYCYLPMAYVEDLNLSDDFWEILRTK